MTDPKDQDPETPEEDDTNPNGVSSTGDVAEISNDEPQAEASQSNEAVADLESDDAQDDGDAEDDLPEWEPLTPEIVEDEAIRGDFMLRWAVVLLAFLLGCRQISETVTLVRIRTGEHLASNGVLPPANDVFSYTATERPWVNLGWLFDLIVAGLYGAGGATVLTLFSAVAAGATFYLIHGISRRETPTWWTSICACVALLMVNLQFTVLPQLITLLGTAWMLRGLHSWSQTGKQSTLWCLVFSLTVWSNLDPRAFIGWIILLAYLAGTAIARKSGRVKLQAEVLPSSPEVVSSNPTITSIVTAAGGADKDLASVEHHADASLKDLSIAAAAGLVALLINPFGWHAILSPVQLYGVEIPALHEYAGRISLPHEIQLVSLLDAAAWDNLNLHTIAALVMAAIAIITSIMNASRADVGLVVAFVATLVLSIVCSHELGSMTLVACVLAALNGQDWYRANCRQEYTIDTLEVLWSRVGRAITVIGFSAIAFMAISGRLMGPDGRRVGLGFSSWFTAAIEATKNEIDSLPDGHIFTFRLAQSDLLLWHGVPTFVDSRAGVFAGGEEDILRVHNQARYALRRRAAATPAGFQPEASAATTPKPATTPASEHDSWAGKRELWEVPFEQYQVKLVTPRMWGVAPDYTSYFNLLSLPDWKLLKLGATSAFFERTLTSTMSGPPATDPDLFRKIAFDDCRVNSDVEPRLEWPRPVSTYQQFLSLPEQPSSSFLQRAQHELKHLSLGVSGAIPITRDNAIGLAVLALRDAVAGASKEPDSWRIYGVQSDVHKILARIESTLLAQFQLQMPTQQRQYQRLFALHQALIVSPDRLEILSELADHYIDAGQTDLAFDMIERAQAAIRNLPDAAIDDQMLQFAGRINQIKVDLEKKVKDTEERIQKVKLEEKYDRVQMAGALRQGGFPGHALALLEEDRVVIADNPSAQLQLAELLLESGRLEEASAMFSSLETLGNSMTLPISVIMQSSWIDLALGNYMNVERRCSERLEQLQKASTQAMLSTLPMSMPSPQFVGELNVWPATQTLVSSRTMTETAAEIALLQWTVAMANIEEGKCEEAATRLKELVTAFPESPFRPLVKIWLKAMTGEEISETPPEPEPGILFHDDSDMVGWMNSPSADEDPSAEKASVPETGSSSTAEPTPGEDKPGQTDSEVSQ